MRRIAACAFAACLAAPALGSQSPAAAPELTAGEIVERNVAARGGLDAWRKIETLVWIGHIENGSAPEQKMSFVLEMKRPNKTRFEVKAQELSGVRIYDGGKGWKVRLARGGKPVVQPYTAEELGFARESQGIDGPLMDYQAKGVAVALEGTEEIDGRRAYRLGVTLPSGASHHVWVDAQSFLELRSDREARNSFGLAGTVAVTYRNYQTFDGVQLPLLLETGAGSDKAPDRMVIDKVLVNAPLGDGLFARPNLPGRHNLVAVEADPRQVRRPRLLPPGAPGAGRPSSGVAGKP